MLIYSQKSASCSRAPASPAAGVVVPPAGVVELPPRAPSALPTLRPPRTTPLPRMFSPPRPLADLGRYPRPVLLASVRAASVQLGVAGGQGRVRLAEPAEEPLASAG